MPSPWPNDCDRLLTSPHTFQFGWSPTGGWMNNSVWDLLLVYVNVFQERPAISNTQPSWREACGRLCRRRLLGWRWPSGEVTMEKWFYLCCKMLFYTCVFSGREGPWAISKITSSSESSCNREKMLYLILFPWWFPGNCLMLDTIMGFRNTQWYDTVRRKKKQGLVSSKHGRLSGTFLMNHKKKKIQSLLMDRRSEPWEARAQASVWDSETSQHS